MKKTFITISILGVAGLIGYVLYEKNKSDKELTPLEIERARRQALYDKLPDEVTQVIYPMEAKDFGPLYG